MDFFKTSAKTGDGIDDAFKHLSKTIIDKSAKAPSNEFGMKPTGNIGKLFEDEGLDEQTITRGSFDSRLMISPTIPLRRDQYREKRKKCAC